jgi:hypothetical protein
MTLNFFWFSRCHNNHHYNIQYNDIQHIDTQYHNNNNATLSITTQYLASLSRLSFILIVVYAVCHYAVCHYAECRGAFGSRFNSEHVFLGR